ncbi:hypothetical protein EDF73_103306 [Raoultella sp. BIGb0138]|uniref:acetyltransferase n=1 Tax=Raoultella sp. BIGb0138 TaxID=2485115 RepID=UPI00105383CE|nr:acetyltransferase [Raoultella sp. BIGb0138]TCW15277.1 hypothetical protein EDF73_103306 [Raoultella sp. BIGb0138]
MKAANTFFCFPSQLPTVRAIIGDAVLETIRAGVPISAGSLLSCLKSPQAKKTWADKHVPLQLAIDALEESLSIDFKKI